MKKYFLLLVIFAVMLTKWGNKMKDIWKYAAVGFTVGLIVMFCIGNFKDKKQIDEEISKIHQQDEAGQPGAERPTPTENPITIEDKETEEQQVMAEQESTFKTDSGEEIPDSNKNVEELYFGIDFVTQKDINEIGKMNSLKKLEFLISGSDIDLSPLTNLTNLEELCIRSGWGEDNLNTAPIGKLKQIKKISLIRCDFDTSFLAQLTNLESVEFLQCTEFEDLSVFENLKRLQYISISYVDDADLNYLKNLTELKYIYIVGANMRNFDGLKNLTNVEELHLCEIELEQKDQIINIEVFVNMHKLTNISIERKRIIDISPLAKIEGLEMITLADTGISDISPLANLENLRELAITGNKSVQVEEQAKKLFTKVERVFISEEVF